MDVRLVVKERLEQLGIEQKDLAAAAQVTESYISQLLNRKKLPPSSDRTDIYGQMEKFLHFPSGRLAGLADEERNDELKRKFEGSPTPLLKEVREAILRKCAPGKESQVRAIFEKQPFGELERLVTQRLLDVVKRVAKEELGSEDWLRLVAQMAGRSYEQMRVIILEFLDADVFNVSIENCASFLDPLIDSWDIDLTTFSMEIVLNRRLAARNPKKFEFVEKDVSEEEPGLKQFLREPQLSGDASQEELEFLKRLRFNGKRPTPLYYYRELQNLRDPVHFRSHPPQRPRTRLTGPPPPERPAAPAHNRKADVIGKQAQLGPRPRQPKRSSRSWGSGTS